MENIINILFIFNLKFFVCLVDLDDLKGDKIFVRIVEK